MRAFSSSVALFALGYQTLSWSGPPPGALPLPTMENMSARSDSIQTDLARSPSITPARSNPTHMTVTAFKDLRSPSPTLDKRDGICRSGYTFCDTYQNCCPTSNYCTVDNQAQGACCPIGAFCTGLSTPLPGLITGGQPGTGAGRPLTPPRVFGFLVALARQVTGVIHRSNNTTADSAPEMEFEGANGDQIIRSNAASGTIGISRPLKIFSFAVALAKQAKAACAVVKNNSICLAPKLKFMGANPAIIRAQNQTSSGSGLLRPLRILSLPVLLANHIKTTLSSSSVAANAVNATENSADDPKGHKGGGGGRGGGGRGPRGGGGGGGGRSGSRSLRPLRIFGFPVALAQNFKAVFASSSKMADTVGASASSAVDIEFPGPMPVRNGSYSHGWFPAWKSEAGTVRPLQAFKLPTRLLGWF